MKFIPTALILALFILLIACPNPDTPDPAICDDGYHPCGPDSQECCLDTTSHEFTWTHDSLGNMYSVVFDAHIVGESNIWFAASLVTDSGFVGAIHYDGNSFSPRLLDLETGGDMTATGIWYFDAENIWVARSSAVQWDQTTASIGWKAQPGGSGVHHIWARSSNDMYFAGTDGLILHYNGISFSQVNESSKPYDYGEVDGSDKYDYTFFVGDNLGDSPRFSAVDMYHDGVLQQLYFTEGIIPTDNNYGKIQGVEVLDSCAYFHTQSGIWEYNFLSEKSKLHFIDMYSGDPYFYLGSLGIVALEGNSPADLFTVSGISTYFHFNGDNWFQSDWISRTQTYGFKMKGDIVVVCGKTPLVSGWQGLISIGRRNN